jgi:hypothetical protein
VIIIPANRDDICHIVLMMSDNLKFAIRQFVEWRLLFRESDLLTAVFGFL